jgi:hypothetical protein
MRGTVWGVTRERARLKLWEIVEDYERMGIKPIRKVDSMSSSFVEFDNGDYWVAIKASENQRGRRSNISYIDYAIPEDIINTIIKPATTALPFQAIRYYWAEGIDEIE